MASSTNDSRKAATESGYGYAAPTAKNLSGLDLVLRLLLLACCVVSAVVLVTSKETELVRTGLAAPYPAYVTRPAKFQHSPALIYLLAAVSVVGLYSIITMFVSISAISKPSPSAKSLFFLIFFDVLMAGVMASATGSAGSVAYVGLRGNSHVNWNKICNVYGKFCRHVGSSVALSFAGSGALVLLVVLSSYSLYKRVQ